MQNVPMKSVSPRASQGAALVETGEVKKARRTHAVIQAEFDAIIAEVGARLSKPFDLWTEEDWNAPLPCNLLAPLIREALS